MSNTDTSALSWDLSTRVHIVGIGGAGMSAIGAVLATIGHPVSGSDLKDSAVMDRLALLGVRVHVGHAASQVGDAELVVISSAVGPSNVEVIAAKELGIPILSRADMLAELTRMKKTVTVAGTHGKTTTTSMLSLICLEAGIAPSFIIGGEVNEIGTNATWGDGEWLVVEADESDGTFLRLDRHVAVLTSLEADHLEHYGSFNALVQAFQQYLANASVTVVCADDPTAVALALDDSIRYGFSAEADVHIENFHAQRSAISFDLSSASGDLGHFEIPVPGRHNARNATAAIAVANELGVPRDVQQRALARFGGVARRFQFRGERHGVSLVDDYAHLPGEVAAALEAATSGDWERVVCVFQPHRYSRVQALAKDFAEAFFGADLLVLTDIYPAGEAPRPGVSSRLILDAVLQAHPGMHAIFIPERADLVSYLSAELRPGDCCLCLGAGDLTSLPDELLAKSDW